MNEMPTMSTVIAKLSVKAGDVVVLKSSEHLSDVTYARIQNFVQPFLPDGVKVLILDRSLELSVLTREEIESRAA